MTIKYFTFNTFSAGSQWLVTGGNGVYVEQDVVVGSTDDFGISGTGGTISVDIDGTVYGDLGGLSLGTTTNAVVRIGDNAQVTGDLTDAKAINLDTFDGTIENRGLIRGDIGVDVFGDNDVRLTNYGTITGSSAAIEVESGSTGSFTLTNFGKVDTSDLTDSLESLVNSKGDTHDTIFNGGVINGIVELGGGDDAYYGASAKPMDGGLIKLLLTVQGSQAFKLSAYVDGGDGTDRLVGSKFTDYFSGGKGEDLLSGNGGDDLLFGSGGADSLTGGKGADQFILQAASDSRGKAVDIITDFNHKEKDTLSFSSIDAHPGTPDDDAFKFIGTHNFSGKPGELRYEIHKNETVVFGNVDHDKQPEFEVHLSVNVHLLNSDFDL